MATGLILEEELKEWTGYRHRDALVNWLRAHKVPYWLGNGGRICVTAEAVNLPLLGIQQDTSNNREEIEF